MPLSRKRAEQNRILRAFPPAVFSSLLPTLEEEKVDVRHRLYEADKPIQSVYFVLDGVASVVASSADSPGVEVATIGPEGFVGLPAFLGSGSATLEAFIQVPGHVAGMSVRAFRRLCSENPQVTAVLMRYTQAFITQISQNSACNRMHPVEERCARWLLQTHDRVGKDTFPLKQEFLAQMLGVRRTSVSLSASTLRERNLIRYERGVITITNRPGLEKASCECYDIVHREYARLLGFEAARA